MQTKTIAVSSKDSKKVLRAPAKTKTIDPLFSQVAEYALTLVQHMVQCENAKIPSTEKGTAVSRYYTSAHAYHKRIGTVFPRARNDAVRLALTEKECDEVLDMHGKGILPSGNKIGQAMFDIWMFRNRA
jgi:hypothetical protein